MEKHKESFTGIYDKNGKMICNGDEVTVVDYNSYYKKPFPAIVVYKYGWKLKAVLNGLGENYDLYAWRNNIEVKNTNRESIYILYTMEELKAQYMRHMPTIFEKYEFYNLLNETFEKAFKLGQELLIQKQNEHI